VKRTAVLAGFAVWAGLTDGARAQKPPLLPEKYVAAMANELSGATAKNNLDGIARLHRQRGSEGFHEAATLVAERLRAYGLSDVAILQFPADGKIFYGTQRSRPAWDAELGELSEVKRNPTRSESEPTGGAEFALQFIGEKIASYDAEPVVLAEDSEGAEVIAELVDAGEGTKQGDYTGKSVKGKIVLVSAQPGAVQDLAVGKFGAAGIVSYAQNQPTAWWGENQDAVRWGHLETFSPHKTFAFMLSLKTARGFKERLAKGERITLHAVVKASQHRGNYEVVTATIPGADAKLKDEEIAFSCHLDHQRPGANDNASGCATILEVARTLEKLISEKKLERPARTIRFLFPPEIEGTLALLTGKAVSVGPGREGRGDGDPRAPEFPKRIKTVIHMDMVGGRPETKAVFHITRGPMSLPSFVHDVAWAFADWVNEESYKFAATGKAQYPMVAREGGKESLRAEYSPYTMGSDHDVYQDSSFAIPAIYLNDWPDRFIHTNLDGTANIDPTKLERAAFIGAASGYFLALSELDTREAVKEVIREGGAIRAAQTVARLSRLGQDANPCEFLQGAVRFEKLLESSATLLPAKVPDYLPQRYEEWACSAPTSGARQPAKEGDANPHKWRRAAALKGPLAVFGYDYFLEHSKAAGIKTPGLLSYEGIWGGGEEYAYEVLNFADGRRNAQEIRDAVSAEYGPIPMGLVVEYLEALEKIRVVETVE
jgi:aminopeptidase YwaD